jgi:signal transduction histidine kinase
MGFSGTAPRAGLARSRAGGDTSSAVSLHDAMLAHELRNSLTPMKIWMYSICEAVATDPQLQRRCLLVAEEIDRLERLVKGYLEAARPGPATNRRQDVRVAIDTALALLHPRIETKQLGLHRDHSPGAALALVDLGHLTQVLVNLLGNAIDAVGDGSSIWITTGLDPRPDGERRVRIRIRDEGPGIATEVREHLFEPFVSTRPNGTGLGLAIVERIVTDLGGCVSVESTAGAGTTVTVWLPAADGE